MHPTAKNMCTYPAIRAIEPWGVSARLENMGTKVNMFVRTHVARA